MIIVECDTGTTRYRSQAQAKPIHEICFGIYCGYIHINIGVLTMVDKQLRKIIMEGEPQICGGVIVPETSTAGGISVVGDIET
jgi:hypothetical protein